MQRFLFVTCLLFAGCDIVQEASVSSGEPADTASTSETVPTPTIELPDVGGDYVLLSADTPIEGLIVPEGLSVEQLYDGSWQISGNDTVLSSGGMTSGVALSLSEELEALASGKEVTVTVLGKTLGQLDAPIKVSYSTADVGNSGFRDLTLGLDWTEQSFTYAVPQMNAGQGDFIGISTLGTSVAIAGLSISITE